MKLLIATANPEKRKELEALLAGLPVEVLTLRDRPDAPHVVEDGATLEENAAKKASETARACGVYAVADDSGLFVDALGGKPGVKSARYAGPDPTSEKLCRKLLLEMGSVPDGSRGAHFRCCIAMADPNGKLVLTAEGRVEGTITHRMRGEGGFGYDPVFTYEPAGKTFAQMTPEEKNAVSHRGRALREFRKKSARWLECSDG
ncbi:MAG: XTP/dITP diphosphatase [Candidatus Brocadiae bacterium]|nr:XTP/dITP diphosphatase [Candidatus Brocadiia bacterium]